MLQKGIVFNLEKLFVYQVLNFSRNIDISLSGIYAYRISWISWYRIRDSCETINYFSSKWRVLNLFFFFCVFFIQIFMSFRKLGSKFQKWLSRSEKMKLEFRTIFPASLAQRSGFENSLHFYQNPSPSLLSVGRTKALHCKTHDTLVRSVRLNGDPNRGQGSAERFKAAQKRRLRLATTVSKDFSTAVAAWMGFWDKRGACFRVFEQGGRFFSELAMSDSLLRTRDVAWIHSKQFPAWWRVLWQGGCFFSFKYLTDVDSSS